MSARTSEAHQYTDTTAGTYWSSTQTGSGPEGAFSITFGVRFDDAKSYYDDITARLERVGRSKDELHILPASTFVLGDTPADAAEKARAI
ncbi:LLM class flavin-dependent oxidoreductase, partial [Bacillus sp. S34]|nr:LLM class flavin-dependent oxidoreductase [Bacillus sp. S34]